MKKTIKEGVVCERAIQYQIPYKCYIINWIGTRILSITVFRKIFSTNETKKKKMSRTVTNDSMVD